MSDGAKRFSVRLSVRDGLLLGLGALGLVLYFWHLPAHHPDAAADYTLGEAGALEEARRFLADLGHATDELEAEVTYRRLPRLLDSLQADIGRTETVAALRGGALDRLPAYYWRVTYYRGAVLGDDERERIYTVSLGAHGGVWEFVSEAEMPGFDRAAVTTAEQPPGSDEPLPALLTDSLLTAVLVFNPVDSVWQAGPTERPARLGLAEGVEGVQALRRERAQGRRIEPPSLNGGSGTTVLDMGDFDVRLVEMRAGPNWAVALARHHLARTYHDGADLVVDSTYLVRSASGARDVAAVRFQVREPYLGRRPTTTLRVAATGGLVGVETAFVPDGPAVEEAEEESSISIATAQPVVEGVVYVALVLILLAVFFRRMGARLLDTRMAMRDALWGGVFAAMLVTSTLGGQFISDFGEPLLGLLAAIVLGVLVGLGAVLLVVFVASAADSVARDVWPEKLAALQLVREASLLNAPVGRALLLGAALTGVLLGALTLVLVLFPAIPIPMGDAAASLGDSALSPIAAAFGGSAFAALFLVQAGLLGLGGLLAQRLRRGVALGLLVVVFALASAGPLTLYGGVANWLLGALVGTVAVHAFARGGALTAFVCLVLLGLVWDLSSGWMVAGAPDRFDAVVAIATLGLCAAAGFIGVINGREAAELQQYVPVYISELAQKERMGRELEIAHQVQEFFLPRRMPEVEGVDVAAMCLAAQEVGGDYYDFIDLGPGRLAVAVGDVSGKGIQAAFFMTLTKGFLQTLARSVDSPAEVLRRLNALFRENAPRGLFVSMIYGVLDVEARTFTFARAGHNPLILTRAPNQEADLVQPAGLAIGLVSGRPFDDVIHEETIHLRPGDTLVFYTDGFSEAMNAARMQYGDDRLARKVSDVSRRSAREILRAVTEDVHHFVEAVGRHDDMTMVVLKLARRADAVASLSRGRQVDVGEEHRAPVAAP